MPNDHNPISAGKEDDKYEIEMEGLSKLRCFDFIFFLIFDQNFDFDENFDFWRKFRFLAKISIFGENFDFWRKFRFLTKI